MSRDALTPRQSEILAFLVEVLLERHSHATMRAIDERFALGSTNAARCHLLSLERKGYVEMLGKPGGWGQTWKILRTPDGEPFQLGNVAAAGQAFVGGACGPTLTPTGGYQPIAEPSRGKALPPPRRP